MRVLFSLLAFAAASAATTTLPAADAPASGIVAIKSFEAGEGFDYAYGTWRQQTETTPEGILIRGQANAKGGGGGAVVADISKARSIFVTLRRLPENRAGVVNLILMDNAGRGAGYALGLARVGTDWTVLQVDITRPSFTPPRMQPNPDWSAIQGYQLQGNHSNEQPVALQLREITAAPPPATAAP